MAVTSDSIAVEVDAVMENYLHTLTAKDNDIFSLYEDNQRMRKLVEDALAARKELGLAYSTQVELVKSLRMQISQMTVAQSGRDAELTRWKSRALQLDRMLPRGGLPRGALMNTSSEQSGVDPIAFGDRVEILLQENEELQMSLAMHVDAERHWVESTLHTLLSTETRERRYLEEAALLPMQSAFANFVRYQSETIALLEQETGARIATLKDLVTETVERHDHELQRWQLECERYKRHLAEEHHHSEVLRASLVFEQLERAQQLSESAILANEQAERIALWVALASCAEKEWGRTSLALQEEYRVDEQQKRQICRMAEDLAQLQESLDRTAAEAANLFKKANQLKHTQRELSECQTERDALITAKEALEAKYEDSVEKLRHNRQHYQKSSQALRESAEEAEELRRKTDEKLMDLERRYARAQEGARSYEKRLLAFEKKVGVLPSLKSALEDAQRRVKEVEAQATEAAEVQRKNYEDELQRLMADSRSELQISERASVVLTERLTAMKESLRETEEIMRTVRAERDALKAQFTDEVQAWARDVDILRQDLDVTRKQLSQERAARSILEAQQQHESGVLQHLLNASATAADESTHTEALQKQVNMLEEACRRSAVVIADLRENIAMGKTTPQPTAATHERVHASSTAVGGSPPLSRLLSAFV